uniref:Uncharacterized protein n=1 Tax=Haptolina brevifila TaxID=156173 RepID=A0A7S2DIN1_9EUKA|mmetsp:Transcript_39321/g.78599  ORF Transcript_39321/g.78599 Transcript_39321/m.78599 type:complete len:176 (+) Transcript_39321:2-529(+)
MREIDLEPPRLSSESQETQGGTAYHKLYDNTPWFKIQFSPAIWQFECFGALSWQAPYPLATPVWKIAGVVWCVVVLVIKDIIFDLVVQLILNSILFNLIVSPLIRLVIAIVVGPVIDVVARIILWIVIFIVKDIIFDIILFVLRGIVWVLAAIVALDGETGLFTMEANAVWSWWK